MDTDCGDNASCRIGPTGWGCTCNCGYTGLFYRPEVITSEVVIPEVKPEVKPEVRRIDRFSIEKAMERLVKGTVQRFVMSLEIIAFVDLVI